MGDGPVGSAVPSLNPNPFYNYGTIPQRSGDTD
jgi:hypothetical protein